MRVPFFIDVNGCIAMHFADDIYARPHPGPLTRGQGESFADFIGSRVPLVP
jgi:hypothetical protein